MSTEQNSANADDAVAGIDSVPVSGWLDANIDGAKGPYSFQLIAGGHSNLTYKVLPTVGEMLVLRRPPLGNVLATAHDMGREHRILVGVTQTDVPVPTPLGFCDDGDVNGAPFYVMSYVDGDVLHDDVAAAKVPHGERLLLGQHSVEVLATLHAVEPDDVGLGQLGKREDYLGRQLRRWTRQWEQSKTRELPSMEQAQGLLVQQRPEQVGSTIVHGDYRLGNMLVVGGRIVGVLDWELCTLGDPLADVGYLMNNWVSAGESVAGTSGPTTVGGFTDRESMLGHYEQLTGRDVSNVDYYRAFSYWRLAAIVEGVLSRYRAGAMGAEADTDVFENQVEFLANQALSFLDA